LKNAAIAIVTLVNISHV